MVYGWFLPHANAAGIRLEQSSNKDATLLSMGEIILYFSVVWVCLPPSGKKVTNMVAAALQCCCCRSGLSAAPYPSLL